MRKYSALILASLIIIPSTSYSQNLFGLGSNSSNGIGIFSCSADGNKQKVGALIGAAAGGYLGNRVAKDNRTLGTIVGAAAGAAAGSYIGCYLQKKDQDKLALASESAMVTGVGSTYNNSETNVYAKTSVISDANTQKRSLKFAQSVSSPASLTLVGGRYSALRASPIRSAPSLTAKTVGNISANEEVDVLAKTSGSSKWAAISEGGVIIGYTQLSSLKELGKITSSESYGSDYKSVNIPVSSVCRTVTQTVKTDNNTDASNNAQVKSCVQTDGSWKEI